MISKSTVLYIRLSFSWFLLISSLSGTYSTNQSRTTLPSTKYFQSHYIQVISLQNSQWIQLYTPISPKWSLLTKWTEIDSYLHSIVF